MKKESMTSIEICNDNDKYQTVRFSEILFYSHLFSLVLGMFNYNTEKNQLFIRFSYVRFVVLDMSHDS